ncbi:MAG: peptidylprolyl isomerase [Deltaproteobacteria bacterium CG23_combo_of_CG06-09_8_20_14_all_60_8]|nr:MAG: hypothetical protein AUK28_01205 [Desulfobacterales bacterium CG2_30_60_27]PIP43851.1 MAG: peptidylprolyl isomerase [Deltaproteobacteria bacterium CG23_combo_of_CG06-09_8_20_14_all_60_8]
MQIVKDGDFLTVEYVGTIASGEIFENTDDSGPLAFQVGQGMVLPAFEQALIGLAQGETITAAIAPEDAYGEKRDELIQTIGRQAMGTNAAPKPGMIFGMTIEHKGEQQQVPAMVIAVDGDQVTVDFNHPLAGQTLTYTITVTTIRQQPDATEGLKPTGCKGCGG